MGHTTASWKQLARDFLCDAMILDLAMPLDQEVELQFQLRYADQRLHRELKVYVSTQDADSAKQLSPPTRIADDGKFVIVRPPHDHFTIRLDFPLKVNISSLEILSNIASGVQIKSIKGGALLFRTGEILHLCLSPPKMDVASRNKFSLLQLIDQTDVQAEAAYADFLAEKVHSELSSGKSYIETAHLKDYKRFLSTRSRVELFMKKLNKCELYYALAQNREANFYVISKHTINPSWLTSRADNYLRAIELIMDNIRGQGIPCYLAYGTLLGALRNEQFIPHDDDVDLIVDLKATSLVELQEGLEDLKNSLESSQIIPRQRSPGIYHLTVDTPFGGVDIFSFWADSERSHLLMESYTFRSISSEILVGPKEGSARLYGKSFPAPPKPEEFLRERYGANWMTPNPYHEWPWPLAG